MVKKTKGFNWGPAATACSEWTGVRMSTLLKYCGVRSAAQVQRFQHCWSTCGPAHSPDCWLHSLQLCPHCIF